MCPFLAAMGWMWRGLGRGARQAKQTALFFCHPSTSIPSPLPCSSPQASDAASELPVAVCLQLLKAAETGVSGETDIQEAATRLASTCRFKLYELVVAKGSLQDMLNDQESLQLWIQLPLQVLLVRHALRIQWKAHVARHPPAACAVLRHTGITVCL